MWMFLLLWVCAPRVAPLPEIVMPPDTLLLREHLVGPGQERTGNWWARFDAHGCYTEGHNTWMWVSDPWLGRQRAWNAHWNTVAPDGPWFCLTRRQRARLLAAARQVPWEPEVDVAAGPVDRWTVAVGGDVRTVVVDGDLDGGSAAPLVGVLEALAEEGVWAQSPESHVHSGIASMGP